MLCNAHKLSVVYIKIALKVCSAFSTASDDTGVLPIDILTDQMANTYNVKSTPSLSQLKNARRERSKGK